jgi:hypothetical protein
MDRREGKQEREKDIERTKEREKEIILSFMFDGSRDSSSIRGKNSICRHDNFKCHNDLAPRIYAGLFINILNKLF